MTSVDPFGLVGQLLDGQFRVDALVGEGGFSAVYRGLHVGLGEPIAIKCLKIPATVYSPPQLASTDTSPPATPVMGTVLVDSFVKRFRDESRILYRLGQGNLNVVRCIASGTTLAPATQAVVPYMVLEWLEGRTLDADLEARAGRGRTVAETMSLIEPVADAIAHAHAMGVVHRDLSPSNIFLATQRDGGTRAKVLDFGIAKVMTDDLELGPRTQTIAQIRIFSPAYAAPEQFDSRIAPPGPYSDVYALALIAVEVLTGHAVRQGSTVGELMLIALDPNAPRTPRALGAPVPEAMEQVFARALSMDPKDRQKDAGELWRELRGAMSTQRIPMDLANTARQVAPPHDEERAPVTARLSPDLAHVKTTARMPPSPTSSSQLFQAPAVPPPPGVPVPDISGPLEALKATQPSVIEPPGTKPTTQRPIVPNAPSLQQTAAPMSAGSTQRAQWLIGLAVFIFVLAAGGVALRLWFLR